MGAVSEEGKEEVAPLCFRSPPLPHTQLQILLKGTGLPKLCPGREETGEFWLLWPHQDRAAGGPYCRAKSSSKEKEQGRRKLQVGKRVPFS